LAQRSSRKRRARRSQGTGAGRSKGEREPTERQRATAESSAEFMARGYARGRAKDEEARASLVPLAPGERPTAVTVAFVVAVLAFVANLVALVLKLGDGDRQQITYTILGCLLLALMAWGMWRVRYWAVLGMQALLAISVLLASLALVTAVNVAAALFAAVIIVGGGALFWFLVKSLARIQMPERPGAR
jgi:hypothetical protein